MELGKFFVIIPARYGSKRFPGKPLVDIFGKPMIIRVLERALKIRGIDGVYVATDHEGIQKAVENYGQRCILTSKEHPSGTDRIHEATKKLRLSPNDVVINVQGDQPLLDITAVEAMVSLFRKGNFSMTTVACKMTKKEAMDPNRVKVVINNELTALYFSRSMIPFDRDETLLENEPAYLRHLGLYCYNVDFLNKFVSWPQGRLETIECLEQLRVLENGYSIGVALVDSAPCEVDTPDDLELVKAAFTS